MYFESGNYYHIYNRGINRKKIFFNKRNYQFFLDKLVKYISPHCSIVAWCLMPNHFHLLIHADERSEVIVDDLSPIKKNTISEGLRISLSSYSKAINIQERRVGNLFQQRTKSKLLETRSVKMHSLNYIETCFHYIHYNPVKAGLVEFENEWGFSSFNEYFGKSVMKICDCELGNFCVDLKSYEKFYVPHLKEFSSY